MTLRLARAILPYMRSLTALALLAPLALAGCSGPLGTIERAWPDGASVHIGKIQANASMTGSGSLTMEDITWTGTNGFPIPGTNTTTTTKRP